MRKIILTLGLFLVGGAAALAQEMRMPLNADQVKWGPAPNAFPPGAQIAVVSGDLFKNGLYVVRLKMPPNYKIPAHNHPTTEYVTVLSGDFHIGMGDKLDTQKGQLLHAGGFAEASAKMNHYAWSTSETVVQIHGQGPFAITYVNPADDPSKMSKASD
jgi:anti-sigma factor ChrR (cupin superfamily)